METTEVKLDSASYRRRHEEFFTMGAPGEYYADTLHTIAISTRETEFGSIVEPIPITLKTYKQYRGQPINGYGYPQQMFNSLFTAHRVTDVDRPSTSNVTSTPEKEEPKESPIVRPPKKKWIKEYLGELIYEYISVYSTNVSNNIKS